MTHTIPADTLEALRAVDSPTVSNAIEELNVRDHREGFAGSRVRCLFPELGVTLGYAVTATLDSTGPGPVDVGRGLRSFCEILEAAPKPAVVIVQDVGPRPARAAMFGEYAAKLFRRLGAVAFITDGAVRDTHEVRALEFACFAGGTSVSHGNPRYVEIGNPIEIDGMPVRTGELIHADVNGLLNVPLEIAEALPDQVAKVRETERAAMAVIDSPEFTLDRALRGMGN